MQQELQSESAETPGAKVAKGGTPAKLPDSECGCLVFWRGSRSKDIERNGMFPVFSYSGVVLGLNFQHFATAKSRQILFDQADKQTLIPWCPFPLPLALREEDQPKWPKIYFRPRLLRRKSCRDHPFSKRIFNLCVQRSTTLSRDEIADFFLRFFSNG